MAQIKSKNEISAIKKACKITGDIFLDIISSCKTLSKTTEVELRSTILFKIKEKGLRPSFPPIVTSGFSAGNEIHPQSTNNNLSGFVIIDLGVRYKGFCSDMTRTIFVGKPTKEDKLLYSKILKAEEFGINLSKVGEKCANIDKKVDAIGSMWTAQLWEEISKEYDKDLEPASKEFYKHSMYNVIASACLCHDIGNPAFGHSGEEAIASYFIKNETAF